MPTQTFALTAENPPLEREWVTFEYRDCDDCWRKMAGEVYTRRSIAGRHPYVGGVALLYPGPAGVLRKNPCVRNIQVERELQPVPTVPTARGSHLTDVTLQGGAKLTDLFRSRDTAPEWVGVVEDGDNRICIWVSTPSIVSFTVGFPDERKASVLDRYFTPPRKRTLLELEEANRRIDTAIAALQDYSVKRSMAASVAWKILKGRA